MTCRCSSSTEHAQRARDQKAYTRSLEREQKKKERQQTPDNTKFQILRTEELAGNLILEVLYPNCSDCSYEGRKVMVFFGLSLQEAILWRKIDPHFRAPQAPEPHEAPSPAARFPATTEGWSAACQMAASSQF